MRLSRRSFACVILSMLMYVASLTSQGTSEDARVENNEGVVSLGRADSPSQLAAVINSLFAASSVSEVDRLVSAPDCAVALAAGWERVRRTMPKAKQQDLVSPDVAALARFLGLVEGRIRTPIPEAWEAAVKSTKGSSRMATWFSYPELIEGALKKNRPRRDAHEWIVEKDRMSIRVPVEDGLGPVDNVAAHLDTEAVYIALYGWPPVPYRLLAVDRASKKVIWSSKVWAAGGLKAYGGQGWHFAETRLGGETLTVFGISEGSAYIEVFDKNTGENRCRFSTSYFDVTTPQK